MSLGVKYKSLWKWWLIWHNKSIRGWNNMAYSKKSNIRHRYIGRQPSYRDIWNRTAVKSVPTSFRSILTHYFLYKYIVWSYIFISLLSSMLFSTLLIACTISVVPVRRLSSSVCLWVSENIYGYSYVDSEMQVKIIAI